MIDYSTYKLVHLAGIFMLFLSLGGSLVWNGIGDKSKSQWRKISAMTHGIGLLLALIGGFGLLARIGISTTTGLPGWTWAKLGIWMALAGSVIVAKRVPKFTLALWWGTIILGATATWLALNKPF